MSNLIIGNLISAVAACFTAASSWLHDREKVFLCQVIQCGVMAVAYLFFNSMSGVTTMALCAVRNFLIAKDKYTKTVCAVFLVIMTALGLMVNNRGLIGLIPIFATALYSVLCYVIRAEQGTRINILVNLLLWTLYDFCILDISSGIADGTVSALTVAAIIKNRKHGRKAA